MANKTKANTTINTNAAANKAKPVPTPTPVEDDESSLENVEEEMIAEPEPEPPAPDVELIADGFGFMPKSKPSSERRDSTVRALQDLLEQAGEPNPCMSGANVDIVRRYTWRTRNGMTVQIISYGATITSIRIPDKNGVSEDVVAGFDSLEEYIQPRNQYFGATIGRYANTITDGTMALRPSGRTYMLSLNKGQHHYHGGNVDFDKVNWRSYVTGNKVIMSHVSERSSEGYPGTVLAQLLFEVTSDNAIKIDMKCTTSEPTIVNLTNETFFNLAGHNAGKQAMYDHIITINADKYTATYEDGIVTGERKVVAGTVYDFRSPKMLRTMMPRIPLGGYDVNLCVTQATEQDLTFHGRALHPGSNRVVEVYSNQPGVQFYTCNLLPDPDLIVEGTVGFGYKPLLGKEGAMYKKHGLFCMMPQNFPDAINQKNFPNCVLNPGEVYVHRMQYKFGLLLASVE